MIVQYQSSQTIMSTEAFKIGHDAKAAFAASQLIPAEERITALRAIKYQLAKDKETILGANQQDMLVGASPDNQPPGLLQPFSGRLHKTKSMLAECLIPY